MDCAYEQQPGARLERARCRRQRPHVANHRDIWKPKRAELVRFLAVHRDDRLAEAGMCKFLPDRRRP